MRILWARVMVFKGMLVVVFMYYEFCFEFKHAAMCVSTGAES
jgi:hypothetical protein